MCFQQHSNMKFNLSAKIYIYTVYKVYKKRHSLAPKFQQLGIKILKKYIRKSQ